MCKAPIQMQSDFKKQTNKNIIHTLYQADETFGLRYWLDQQLDAGGLLQ